MSGSSCQAWPPSGLLMCLHLPQPHSDVHPAPLPPEHIIVFLVRVLPETPREAFALWQMTAEDFQPVLGVLLDGDVGPQQSGGVGQGGL